MIVMVMGDDHGINDRKVADLARHLRVTLRT